jgi:hypothetical protein
MHCLDAMAHAGSDKWFHCSFGRRDYSRQYLGSSDATYDWQVVARIGIKSSKHR